MEQSESIAKLTAALITASGKFAPLVPDKVNPHFRSKYASLNQCIAVSYPALAEHGLIVTQWMEPGPDDTLACTTQLQHTSGEWQRSTLYLPMAKADPQGAGSAITYARRYGYCAALCLAPDEDDDGNAVSSQRHPTETLAPRSTGNADTPPVAAGAAGDNMTVTWGKKDGPWYGKTFQEVWDSGGKGHSYLHWIAEEADTMKPAVKAAARKFIDRMKAGEEQPQPEGEVFASPDALAAFRLLYESAGGPLEWLGEQIRAFDASHGGVPLSWIKRQTGLIEKKLAEGQAPAEKYSDVAFTPENEIDL